MQDITGLAFFLIVTFGVSFLASQYEPGGWYQEIAKPSWTPPGWIFPIVWTALYLMMSIAAWKVWRTGKLQKVIVPLGFYFLQLFFNGLWSWMFFGNQMIGLALLDIILLLIAIILTTIIFWKYNRVSGLLFIPYLLWVAFASVLNFSIWLLNRAG